MGCLGGSYDSFPRLQIAVKLNRKNSYDGLPLPLGCFLLISFIVIGFLVIDSRFAEDLFSELFGKCYQFALWIPGQRNQTTAVSELGTHLMTSAVFGLTSFFKIDVSAGGELWNPFLWRL